MDNLKQPRNIIYSVIIAASLIAILILCIDFSKNSKNEKEVPDTATTAASIEKRDKVLITVNVETIQDGLQNMGTLITQEYYFTQVETYTKEKNLLGFIPSSSEIAYSYDGTVTAGVDFEKITISKDEAKKTIIVDIPDSEIQTVSVDKNTFKVYSEKDSLWNPMKLEDYNVSLAEFEEAAKKKALENGIIERSDEQAKTLIGNFIKNFPSVSGFKIEFR
ncbi:DUF4230 domain-containing protein [Butyrivibrio sp. VCD2006]|uniref:DUF4230 domain-containing protein n=1 Tax=Butyrivibrio sp. VCD2006 TaxID=1280664 RepID=UPI00041AB8EA|nr:DUF4230 domain-containing protein [Butyrivibrio sp. VCD2006]